MPHFERVFRKPELSLALGFAALFLLRSVSHVSYAAPREAQNAPDSGPRSYPPGPQPPVPPPEAPAAAPQYNQAIFQNHLPPDQLKFLTQFAGAPSKDLIRNKPFRKLLRNVIPNCTFHYGHDLPLSDAVDEVVKGSPQPVQIRDGRYLTVSGLQGPYLAGRGFLWLDLQAGIGLGTFYFHPTNGEPTPAVNIFSRQVKEPSLSMRQLPPAFYQDFLKWTVDCRVPPVTPRYFITGFNRKIVLEHDEDYCATVGDMAVALPPACEQMNADAADTDLDAAYYLEQTHHATNSTAWMITGSDMTEWLQFRDQTCRAGPNPLQCRLRMTRAHAHAIITHGVAPHPLHR